MVMEEMARCNSGPSSKPNCRLHPLIHTIDLKDPAQNVVGNPNKVECKLEYDIFGFQKKKAGPLLTLPFSFKLKD